jgi:hypothetical protein
MKLARRMLLVLFISFVATRGNAHGPRERGVPPLQEEDYGPKFFEQLSRMFRQFSQGDPHHFFQTARPVQCSDLADRGEWKDVAFFSGRKKFGDWYRMSLEEVKNDLAVYIFSGVCQNQRASLQVTTKVPIEEIRVKVNPPVRASFNSDAKGYTFDLPYLFRGTDQNGDSAYTFYPARVSDRYVTHITSHWECKAVAEEYVTYQFLICHTTLFGHDPVDIKPDMRDKPTVSFGASAYTILSNGKSAFTLN